jgi:hypothetical protein
MADVHTKEQRSFNMSPIKSKNTKPDAYTLTKNTLHNSGVSVCRNIIPAIFNKQFRLFIEIKNTIDATAFNSSTLFSV